VVLHVGDVAEATHGVAIRSGRRRAQPNVLRTDGKRFGATAQPPGQLARHDVRAADEARDERRRRAGVEHAWRVELLDPAVIEHGDAIRHRQRLALVVRDEHERDAEPPLQILQLDLHFFAQLQVERAERLIQQQHRRLIDQGSRQ